MLAGLVTNLVFGFIRAAILFAAVDSAGGNLGGYTTGTISAYVWLSQGLLGSLEMSGRAAYTLIPRGLPSVLIGGLTVGLVLPTTVLPYVLGIISIVIGVAISFY